MKSIKEVVRKQNFWVIIWIFDINAYGFIMNLEHVIVNCKFEHLIISEGIYN